VTALMNKQQGFSLLEILIAFSIMALSLGILLKIFSGGINTASVAEEYTTAVQIAESLLVQTGVETPLQQGEMSGVENDRFYWLVSVSPYTSMMEDFDPALSATALFQVKVMVTWGDDRERDRQVELTTLRLVNKAL
jgi:general secretion pathway protein I